MLPGGFSLLPVYSLVLPGGFLLSDGFQCLLCTNKSFLNRKKIYMHITYQHLNEKNLSENGKRIKMMFKNEESIKCKY